MSDGGLFDPFSLRLVGRDVELAASRQAVEEDVGCLAIVGEALVGATRLGFEVVGFCRERGMRVRWAESAAGTGGQVGEVDDVPTVVFVGDGASDAELQAWARAYRGSGSIVVATSSSSRGVPTVALGRLCDDDMGDLVGQVDAGLAGEVVERIVALSDGLPGCAIELALAPPVVGQPLPERLQRLLDNRCGWLRNEPELLDLAKVAAGMGLFDIEGLSDVLKAPHNQVESGLGALRRRDLIGVRDEAGGVLAFTHHLSRSVLLDPAPEAPWTVAKFEPVPFAESALRALLNSNVRLAEQAIDRRDWALAGDLCEPWVPAVDVLEDAEVAGSLFAVLGHSREGLARFPSAQEAFARAARHHDQTGSTLDAERCRHHADRVGVRIHSRNASDEVVGRTAIQKHPRGQDLVVETYRAASDHRWLDVQRLAAADLESTSRFDVDASEILRLAVLKAEADLNVDLRVEAVDDLERLLGHAIEHTMHPAIAEVVGGLFVYLAEWKGDLEAGREVVRRGLAAMEASNEAVGVATLRTVLGCSLADFGHLDELAGHTQGAVEDPWDLSGRLDLSTLRMSLGRGIGDFEAIVRIGGRVLQDKIRRDVAVQAIGEILGAAVYLDRTDLTNHPQVLELASLPQLKDGCVMNRLLLFVAFAEARVPGADSWAELLANGRYPLSTRGEAMRLMAAGFESDLAAGGCENFLASARLFYQLGVTWWEARALLAAGESADEGTARGLLERAHQVFESIGATGWTVRCQEAMRERGIRWRRSTPANGALSARELEIVGLVGTGLTNAQIARHLVLSENTVARHLTRIFRKLGVRSRRELAAQGSAPDSRLGA